MLAQVAIALSVFSLITYLWLGLIVLLIGNRRSLVTWVGALGLLLGALFFLTHGALVGGGVPTSASPSDFWWRLAWVPAFGAPLFWAAVGLHYAELAGVWRRLRLPALLAVGCVGVLTALLALLSWSAIAHYGDFVRLVDMSLRGHHPSQTSPPTLPGLGLGFVIYVAACACLPWASLVARRLLPALEEKNPSARSDAMLLWDARDAWSRARPALLAASLFMMGAGAVVALIGVLVSLAKGRASTHGSGSGLPLTGAATLPGHVPLVLVVADLGVQVALAGVGLSVGWAVVRQGILVERRLPQRGYLSHWLGMAIVAGIFACVVAAMAAIEPEALPMLLLLVALVAGACAVVTWQAYVAHDNLLTQLRPFVASFTEGHAGWLATDPDEVERNVLALFTSLCRDVLGAAHGRLALSVGRLHRTFTFEAPQEQGDEPLDAREWVLPISDEHGVIARIVLGPRADGAGYTSADLEVARACGQRILDAVGEFAAAQAIASLARQRGLESELSAALPRRVLHDEVLPRLHLAMLKLEALRAHAKVPVAASAQPLGPVESIYEEIGEVVRELGHTHHDLAALMRATPIANQRRLEHGLVSALRSSMDGEFRGTFDSLDWQIEDGAEDTARALPIISADLLLGAAQEAIRNARRYARGGDLHRHLKLTIAVGANDRWVTISIADDGVGLQSEQALATEGAGDSLHAALAPGTRSGLLTHGALLALVGGALSVQSPPGGGTTVVLRVPRASGTGTTEAGQTATTTAS
jgi:signal transduction histidine kinase